MRATSAFEQTILSIIDEPLKHMNYYVVQLMLGEGQRGKSLQLTVERSDDTPMTVDDCEAISTTVSALMDVHDPIESAYDLEVSSPGLERPLTVLSDFEKYQGQVASIELAVAQNGRKRFKGEIGGVEGENVAITVDGQSYALPFADIKNAHLVATEEIIRALLAEEQKNSGGSRRFGRKKQKKNVN